MLRGVLVSPVRLGSVETDLVFGFWKAVDFRGWTSEVSNADGGGACTCVVLVDKMKKIRRAQNILPLIFPWVQSPN